MNPNWLRVDSAEFQKEKHFSPEVSFSISPFEIPEAFRVFLDEKSSEVVIEFRYPDGDEPTVGKCHTEDINLVVGKKSNRVFQVRFNKDKFSDGVVRFDLKTSHKRLIDAFKRLETPTGRNQSLDNHRVAKRLIFSKSKEMVMP